MPKSLQMHYPLLQLLQEPLAIHARRAAAACARRLGVVLGVVLGLVSLLIALCTCSLEAQEPVPRKLWILRARRDGEVAEVG